MVRFLRKIFRNKPSDKNKIQDKNKSSDNNKLTDKNVSSEKTNILDLDNNLDDLESHCYHTLNEVYCYNCDSFTIPEFCNGSVVCGLCGSLLDSQSVE